MSSLTPRESRPSGTVLRIAPGELDRLHAHAVEGHPHEVVGILAGDRARWAVSRVVPLINERADSARNRYRVDGLGLMRAEQRLERDGLEVVGYYHSHPDHPASWSDYDRDHALPNMSYVITSVRSDGGQPRIAETRSWRLRDDRTEMDAEELLVEQETA